MSRIHEALLKAQREHGIENENLNLDAIELKFTEGVPISEKESVAEAPPLAVAEELARTEVNQPECFPHHAWRPDQDRLVFLRPEFSRGIEEFRTLRSRLLRERAQRYLKTVLITGAAPGEGKTFVAANLALAMARNAGSRVLLIDADLRRSSLHTVFGMDATPGLSGYLSGKVEPRAIVRQTPDPQLCIVTAGKHSDTPTELLHSGRMQQFLEQMAQSFDWIFIDSPPAVSIADSVVVSDMCDGVVLVIAAGTPIAAAQKSRKEIARKIVGVVLNRAEEPAASYSYYSYNEKLKEKSGRAKTSR